jgi:broad specificity phosphatase PhoE
VSARATPPAGVRTVAPSTERSTRLVLVRHGEATCNVAGVVGGIRGCSGLSETGVLQAEALRDRLLSTAELAAATALYASVLPRALETAAIVGPGVGASGRLTVVADCDLCELHPGEGDGLTWPEFSARFGEPDWDADPTTVLAPGGESWSGFVARAAGALEAVVARHRDDTVVVVCHAGVIEASLISFVPVCPARRMKLRTEHTALTEWEVSTDGWRLLRYNDAAHLALA